MSDLTPNERHEIIGAAYQLDASAYESETGAGRQPGRFEGCPDLSLAVALDILTGAGAADEVAGSVEHGRHGARVGRVILWTDDRGFYSVETHESETRAADVLADEEREQNRPDPDAEIPIRAGDVSQAIDAMRLALDEGFGWRNALDGARVLLADALAEAGAEC